MFLLYMKLHLKIFRLYINNHYCNYLYIGLRWYSSGAANVLIQLLSIWPQSLRGIADSGLTWLSLTVPRIYSGNSSSSCPCTCNKNYCEHLSPRVMHENVVKEWLSMNFISNNSISFFSRIAQDIMYMHKENNKGEM